MIGFLRFLFSGINRAQASGNCPGANCSKQSTSCSNTSSGSNPKYSANSTCSGGQCSANNKNRLTIPGMNCESGVCRKSL
jgi:hypothetical protein